MYILCYVSVVSIVVLIGISALVLQIEQAVGQAVVSAVDQAADSDDRNEEVSRPQRRDSDEG